jgi:hypothetical protein
MCVLAVAARAGSPKLLRKMTFSAQRKEPIVEIDLSVVLEDMKLSMDEVCIHVARDVLPVLFCSLRFAAFLGYFERRGLRPN